MAKSPVRERTREVRKDSKRVVDPLSRFREMENEVRRDVLRLQRGIAAALKVNATARFGLPLRASENAVRSIPKAAF